VFINLLPNSSSQKKKQTKNKQTSKQQKTKNVLPLTLLTLNFSGYPTVFISILDKHCQNPDLVPYNQGKKKKRLCVLCYLIFIKNVSRKRTFSVVLFCYN
jgi:hypothetical protein